MCIYTTETGQKENSFKICLFSFEPQWNEAYRMSTYLSITLRSMDSIKKERVGCIMQPTEIQMPFKIVYYIRTLHTVYVRIL